MSLVTTANYKYYLGIGQADTTKDTELASLISAVEKRIKEFLKRDIESATYTDELYDGSGKNCLVLRQFPITSVTSIKVYDGISSSAQVWTTLIVYTDYDRLVIPVEAHLFYLDGYLFVRQLQNYKVTYVAGYTSIPDDIQMTCKELLKITYANSPISGDNRLGFLNISNNAGGGSQNLSIDPEIEMKILNKIGYYKELNV